MFLLVQLKKKEEHLEILLLFVVLLTFDYIVIL